MSEPTPTLDPATPAADPIMIPPPTRQPATGQPETGQPAPGRGSARAGFIGGVLGGLAVIALAAALIAANVGPIRRLLLAPADDRLTVLESMSAEQADQLRHLALNAPPSPSAPTPAAPSKAAEAVTGDTSPLAGRMAQVEADVAALRRAMPDQSAILRLADSAQAGEKVAKEIAHQHASAQALLLASAQLRDAVDRGTPFETEWKTVATLAGDDAKEFLDALSPYAAVGIPPKDTLIAAFPSLADDALRASLLPAGDGFWRHVLARLSTVVTIRRVDGKGVGPAATLGRATLDVRQGDLSGAIRDLKELSGPAADTLSDWVKSATGRDVADRALSSLAAISAAQSAKISE